MNSQMIGRRNELMTITKNDPHPAVRHRAHILLVAVEASSPDEAARQCDVSVRSIFRWQARLPEEGRAGLVDRPKSGRSSKLGPDARQLITAALEQSPVSMAIPSRSGPSPICAIFSIAGGGRSDTTPSCARCVHWGTSIVGHGTICVIDRMPKPLPVPLTSSGCSKKGG